MNPPLLAIRDLTITYRRDSEHTTALNGVSFDVPRGAVTAIIGESGSGKSTLAHAIVRLLADNAVMDGGKILLAGESILERSDPEFRPLRGRRIGFVPQDPTASLNPTKTVGAQIREAYRLARSPLTRPQIEEQIEKDLREVGFDDPAGILRRYPHQLSGGQRQRILVTIAFSQRPELVIADEPTSALDALVGKEVMRNIHDIRRAHDTTLLIITHDLALAARNADYVVVLSDGDMVEAGPTVEVFASPQHTYTQTLLADSSRLRDGKVVPLAEVLAVRQTLPALHADAEVIASVMEITKRFGPGTPAVDGVSFDLREGETFAIVGESGSGKTTTGRILLGLEEPTSGSVRVFGHDLIKLRHRARRDIRRRIQVVYQNPYDSLNPRLSLRAIVAEPLVAYGIGTRAERSRRVGELLEVVGLPAGYAARRPRELSGGQRQRVAIARALALSPALIVLDEPVSALDATVQSQILDLLRSIQIEVGVSYLLVTHDLSVVAEVAHTVAVMQSGRIVEAGSVDQIVRSPSADYTEALLSV